MSRVIITAAWTDSHRNLSHIVGAPGELKIYDPSVEEEVTIHSARQLYDILLTMDVNETSVYELQDGVKVAELGN